MAPAKVEAPPSHVSAKVGVDAGKSTGSGSQRVDAPRAVAADKPPQVSEAKSTTTTPAAVASQAAQVQANAVRPVASENAPKSTSAAAPSHPAAASSSAPGSGGQPAPTNRNAPIVGGRKNEAVENVRLAAAGDATQKGGGGGQASTGAKAATTSTQAAPLAAFAHGASSTTPPAKGQSVATTPGVAPGMNATSTPATLASQATTGASRATASVTSGATSPASPHAPSKAGAATAAFTKSGSVVVAPSGRQVKIETKKVVETVKTRAVVERTVQTQRQENVIAVQQTATVAKVVTETTQRAAVQTAVRVAETHVATQAVTTTVQHQQTKAGTQKVAEKAMVASADMAATVQASAIEAERMTASTPGQGTPFRADGALARAPASEHTVDKASDKELETLSQGLSRVDIVEAARAFAESDHGVDLGPIVRAQRESDIQDAFFRETQASTVSLGSHAAPPFSNVSVALDRKFELSIELTREERAQMKSAGAPYASADDGAVAVSLGGAKAIEEMSGVLSFDFGLEVSELGDAMRTLMDSDGGGDDGGGDGGGDEGGGGEGGGGGGE